VTGNIAEVQQRMPNRNGMTHRPWHCGPASPARCASATAASPTCKAVACMKDCVPEPAVRSALPDFARNAHGNLAEQNRMVGAHSTGPTPPARRCHTAAKPAAPAAPSARPTPATAAALGLLKQHGCVVCHGMDSKIVGPAFSDVAKKYAGRADAQSYLAQKDPERRHRDCGARYPCPHKPCPPGRRPGHRKMAGRRRQEMKPASKEIPMQTRRKMLIQSAQVAGLLAAAGLLPATAHAAWNQAAFDAKTLADVAKALGGSAPAESKDVSITGPDIAENGAVVPVGCASTPARREAPAAAGGEEPQRAGRHV
jgi:cytochrome c551/c552